MNIKNGLNSQKWSTVNRNLFEMFLKNNGLKGNSKALCYNYFCLIYIYFDRTSRKNYGKWTEQCYDQWYLRILLSMYNYLINWNFEGTTNCDKVKEVQKITFIYQVISYI